MQIRRIHDSSADIDTPASIAVENDSSRTLPHSMFILVYQVLLKRPLLKIVL